MLDDCNFTVTCLNDILIKRESHEQHVEHVRIVLERIREYGFKLSEEECEGFPKEN